MPDGTVLSGSAHARSTTVATLPDSSSGVFNGVLSATRPRSFADPGPTFFALFFYSMPSFLLGLLLYFLHLKLNLAGFKWFPAGGCSPPSEGVGPRFQHLMPSLALALLLAATYTRLTRGSMLDVLGEDYIRTARSKASPNTASSSATASGALSRPLSRGSASTSVSWSAV